MNRRFGLFLVGVLVAGCSTTGEIADPGPSTTASPSTTTSNALDRALRAYGVDVDAAPPGAAELAGATFCGASDERLGAGRAVNGAARRCFLDGNAAQRSVVFVRMQSTVEGDPIVTVYRSNADGRVDIFTDATRDKFGSGKWEHRLCTDCAAEVGAG